MVNTQFGLVQYLCAGGTLAIYSLLCRHAKVKLIPNQRRSDEDLTTYIRTVSVEGSFAAKTKKWLEAKHWRKRALLVIVLLGTCMMIGDGILTPAISGKASSLAFFLELTKNMIISTKCLYHLFTVLSATGGIKVNGPKMSSGITFHRTLCQFRVSRLGHF